MTYLDLDPHGGYSRAMYVGHRYKALAGKTALVKRSHWSNSLEAQFDDMSVVHYGKLLGVGWHLFTYDSWELVLDACTVTELIPDPVPAGAVPWVPELITDTHREV
jgi:hypothetical protein